MQFISVLSAIVVAVLAAFSGLAVLVGGDRESRKKVFWFFLSAVIVMVWAANIATFLLVFPTKIETSKSLFMLICVCSVLLLLLWVGSMIVIFIELIQNSSKRIRRRLFEFLISEFMIGLGAGCLGILLPLMGNFSLMGWAPVVVGVGLIGCYYQILRYRLILVRGKYLRFLSYVVVIAAATIVYMVIFYLVFTYIFRLEELSTTMLALNFVMIIIALILFPAINEATNFAQRLISQNQVDLTFVIKKLNKMATENVDLEELADFLAMHLHFKYVGLAFNGRLYGSKKCDILPGELIRFSRLGRPEHGIWQALEGEVGRICRREKIKAVADLRDAAGKNFGQILIGAPVGKERLTRKDLIQVEMIVNLVAAMIDTKAKRTRR